MSWSFYGSKSNRVSYTEDFIYNARGVKLFTCRWIPLTNDVKGLVFLCHGYGMECGEFMRGTGHRLSRAGYAVFGIDYEGHGRSEGRRCYIHSFDNIVNDCVSFFKSVRAWPEYREKPCFLYGESMGGAVALLVQRRTPGEWDGAILVAPMCKIAKNMKPHPLLIRILVKLSRTIPTWKVVPIKDVIAQAFKDPVKREQIRANPYIYQGPPRLRTAVEMLYTSMDLECHLHEVTIPFLVLHGADDVVTDPEISRALYETAASYDKTINIYRGMWHGLTTGEPDQNIDLVFRDIISWLDKRCPKGRRAASPVRYSEVQQRRSALIASSSPLRKEFKLEGSLRHLHSQDMILKEPGESPCKKRRGRRSLPSSPLRMFNFSKKISPSSVPGSPSDIKCIQWMQGNMNQADE